MLAENNQSLRLNRQFKIGRKCFANCELLLETKNSYAKKFCFFCK